MTETPWPDGTIQLFKSPASKRDDIHLPDRIFSSGWDIYATAYRDAYEYLLTQINKDGIYSDALFFPIGYLCRHYIELRLKQLTINRHILEKSKDELAFNHDLKKLWSNNRPFLERTWPEEGTETPKFKTLDFVGDFISEFSEHDFRGTEFRYPENKNGPSLPGLKSLDLEKFREGMSQIANFLDSVCGATSEYIESFESASE